MSSVSTPITVTLPSEIVEQIDDLAKRRHSARSKIVDAAITEYLARHGNGHADAEHEDLGKAGASLAAKLWPDDDFSDWEEPKRAKTRPK